MSAPGGLVNSKWNTIIYVSNDTKGDLSIGEKGTFQYKDAILLV